MRQILKHIPNGITCLNLASGVVAIMAALSGEHHVAVLCIILAAVFDFFDGLVARALGVTSPIGKDLDSLADVISFGVAPAMLLVDCLCLGRSFNLRTMPIMPSIEVVGWIEILPILLLPIFAGLRLAKFNNDTRQHLSFIGLPVPANALFWIGYSSWLIEHEALNGLSSVNHILTITLIVLLSYLMVSELPMFSFKLSGKLSLSEKWPQLVLIILTPILLPTLGWIALSIIILLYTGLSLVLHLGTRSGTKSHL